MGPMTCHLRTPLDVLPYNFGQNQFRLQPISVALFKLVCILVNFLRSVKMSIKVSSAFKKSSYRISPNLSMFSNFRALMRFPVDSTKSIKIFCYTLSPYFTRIYPKITRKSILFHPSIMTHHMIS